MNILIDSVPLMINIGGTEYGVNSDFRIWIMFEQLLTDTSVTDTAKNSAAFNLIFSDEKPPLTDEAISKILWFYSCGKEADESNSCEEEADETDRRIYDYDCDDDYIYSAFLQQYKIDLQTAKLHWWQFRALLKGLTDDCKFVEIMSYRAIKIDGDMPKRQREFYRKMKKLYALPVSADEIERTKAIEDALLAGKGVNNLL